MSTVLYSSIYLDGQDPLGNNRLERTLTWERFHNALYTNIGVNSLRFSDNGSCQKSMADFVSTIGCWIITPFEHIPRLPIDNGYQYCWRALWFIRGLILSGIYTKIIFLDNDCYIVSGRLAKHIKNLNTGWESFYIPRYNFPSTECFVLCQDAFPLFLDYTKGPWEDKVGELMEMALPFTKVNKDFVCDRFGEDSAPQTLAMDGYFQRRLTTPLKFHPLIQDP